MLPGNTLSPAIAFTSLALFDVLRFPLMLLPNVLNQVVRLRVALERIQDILTSNSIELESRSAPSTTQPAVELHDGTFAWDASTLMPILEDINLSIKHVS